MPYKRTALMVAAMCAAVPSELSVDAHSSNALRSDGTNPHLKNSALLKRSLGEASRVLLERPLEKPKIAGEGKPGDKDVKPMVKGGEGTGSATETQNSERKPDQLGGTAAVPTGRSDEGASGNGSNAVKPIVEGEGDNESATDTQNSERKPDQPGGTAAIPTGQGDGGAHVNASIAVGASGNGSNAESLPNNDPKPPPNDKIAGQSDGGAHVNASIAGDASGNGTNAENLPNNDQKPPPNDKDKASNGAPAPTPVIPQPAEPSCPTGTGANGTGTNGTLTECNNNVIKIKDQKGKIIFTTPWSVHDYFAYSQNWYRWTASSNTKDFASSNTKDFGKDTLRYIKTVNVNAAMRWHSEDEASLRNGVICYNFVDNFVFADGVPMEVVIPAYGIDGTGRFITFPNGKPTTYNQNGEAVPAKIVGQFLTVSPPVVKFQGTLYVIGSDGPERVSSSFVPMRPIGIDTHGNYITFDKCDKLVVYDKDWKRIMKDIDLGEMTFRFNYFNTKNYFASSPWTYLEGKYTTFDSIGSPVTYDPILKSIITRNGKYHVTTPPIFRDYSGNILSFFNNTMVAHNTAGVVIPSYHIRGSLMLIGSPEGNNTEQNSTVSIDDHGDLVNFKNGQRLPMTQEVVDIRRQKAAQLLGSMELPDWFRGMKDNNKTTESPSAVSRDSPPVRLL